MNKVFKSVKYILTLLIVTTMILPYPSVVEARANKYNLGETLAPDCAPGDTNCTVKPPQTNNAYLTNIADITATQGDVLYFNGTDWVNLGAGTSGYFLKTLGSGANPIWSANTTGVITLGTDTDGNYLKSLASGTGLSGGSAGSEAAELTLNLDIDGLITESSINDADTLAIYDASASAIRKITRANFLSGVTGALTYQGAWNASSNSPVLADNTGTQGQYYVITTAGSLDLGSGSISFTVGDWVIHNGSKWEKLDSTNDVQSVFGRSGIITASSGDYIASQITNTASGNISAITVQNALNELDTEKQGLDAQLTDIAGLTPTDSYFIVGNGTNFITENGSTLKSSIGIGNVENTALSTWIGSTNLTTFGTVATGTWQGTSIADAYIDNDITASNYLPLAGGTMTGDVALNAQSDVRFADADSSNYVGFQASSTIASNLVWTLPVADGVNGQVLSTNGSGLLTWASTGNGDITSVGSMTSGATFADATADDDWLGLGASAGRIEFDDQTTDEVNILGANVGIGTASPESGLDLRGSGIAENSQSKFTLSTPDNQSIVNGSLLGATVFSVDDDSSERARETGAYMRYVASETWDNIQSNGYLGFGVRKNSSTVNDDILVIEGENGNVGIGTSTPNRKLTVRVNTDDGIDISAINSPNMRFMTDITGDARNWMFASQHSLNGFELLRSTVAGGIPNTSVMAFDKNGNVGIGTTTPNSNLVIEEANPELNLNSSAAGGSPRILFSGTGTGNVAMGILGAGDVGTLRIAPTAIDSTATMVVNTTSGRVGIGTTNPGWKLDLYSSGNSANAAAYLRGEYYGTVIGTQATAAPYYALAVYTGVSAAGTGGTERFKVLADGDVCGPDSDLSNCASDARLKENVVNYEYGLDEVLALRPVIFDWNAQGQKLGLSNDGRNVGFIAQEVEDVIPSWVTERGDGYKKVPGEGEVKFALINAVKELNEKLEEKDSEIQLLKSELCAKDNSYSWCE